MHSSRSGVELQNIISYICPGMRLTARRLKTSVSCVRVILMLLTGRSLKTSKDPWARSKVQSQLQSGQGFFSSSLCPLRSHYNLIFCDVDPAVLFFVHASVMTVRRWEKRFSANPKKCCSDTHFVSQKRAQKVPNVLLLDLDLLEM